MRDVWFGRGIKSLKSKDLSPPVAFIKPKVCLGPIYLVFIIISGMSNAELAAMVRTLTLKVDALASRGAGGSRDSSPPNKGASETQRRVQVENKGIIIMYNNFFVLLSLRMIDVSITRRMNPSEIRRDMRKPIGARRRRRLSLLSPPLLLLLLLLLL